MNTGPVQVDKARTRTGARCGQVAWREGSWPRGQLRGPCGGGQGQLGRSLHPRLPAAGQGPGMPPGQCLAESSFPKQPLPFGGPGCERACVPLRGRQAPARATREAPTGPCAAPVPPRLGSPRLPGRTNTPGKLITTWLQMKFIRS